MKECCSLHQCFHFQFPSAFFQGPADLCGSFCYEVLKCCNHRSRSTQTEASALLYFFMRKNFEFNKQKSIVRSHLQVSAASFHWCCCWNHSSVSVLIKRLLSPWQPVTNSSASFFKGGGHTQFWFIGRWQLCRNQQNPELHPYFFFLLQRNRIIQNM